MFEERRKHLTHHPGDISREERESLNKHKGRVLWFTGLSGSGKSTVARRVEKLLYERGMHCTVLDGDNIRLGLNRDLGFSPEDREENLRRIAEVARLFAEAGVIVIVSLIAPYRKVRDTIRDYLEDDFVEVFVDCPVEVCEERDPKGLYAKARAGIIKNFTGIDAPYEEPESAEVHLRTDVDDVDACAKQVIAVLEKSI